MSRDDLDGWGVPPPRDELPPFTDDEITVYEAIDRLWHAARHEGRRWVMRDELNRACSQFEPRTVGHHIVWLHIQHLIVWNIDPTTLDATSVAPSELPPPWRHQPGVE